MTYKEFLKIEYNINKEKNYYCWVVANYCHSKDDEDKYEYYKMKSQKINNFKKKVLTEALKKISKDFF